MEDERKLKVYKVAKELFERFGFKKTTVDEIAAKAGISKRTLYELFGSKEKILSELVLHEGRLVAKMARQRLKKIDDPLKKLEEFTQIGMNYFKTNPFLAKVLGDEAGLYAPFLRDEIRIIEDGIESFFYEILCEGTEKGIFRPMDERASANCIFILFRSFTYGHTLKPNKAWVQFIRNAILPY